jgi:microcystin-dependent protein
MDPFIGEVRMFAGTYAPMGWVLCNGQLLPIQQNQALFALLGVNYGGDGVTTFGVPDLRGRLPMHWGNGPGLSPRVQGQYGGTESVTLNATQMPAHTHALLASSGQNANRPAGAYVGGPGAFGTAADTTMAASAAAGGSQAHENMPPFLTITFIMATEGVWPSRP